SSRSLSRRSFLFLSFEEIGKRAQTSGSAWRLVRRGLALFTRLTEPEREAPFVTIDGEYYHIERGPDLCCVARVPKRPPATQLTDVRQALDPGRHFHKRAKCFEPLDRARGARPLVEA